MWKLAQGHWILDTTYPQTSYQGDLHRKPQVTRGDCKRQSHKEMRNVTIPLEFGTNKGRQHIVKGDCHT